MNDTNPTRFGSLRQYDKGRVEPICDDVRNYAFSNCFEIANAALPYERVVFGQNQIYVLEVVRCEGASGWFTCAHDEFALCMDGEVRVNLARTAGSFVAPAADRNGAVSLPADGLGSALGWMKLGRGHQGMLPARRAYQFVAEQPGVVILQTCKGELSVERWAAICQNT